MAGYLAFTASQLGVSIFLLAIIFIWSTVWKLIALWKSARKGSIVWFIVLALVNTIGILEILYIYVFSEMKPKKNRNTNSSQRARKRRR